MWSTADWDCCKPSCGWSDAASNRRPNLHLCDTSGNVKSGAINSASACDDADGEGITMCPDAGPFYDEDSGTWMGFVASPWLDAPDSKLDCCDCY